MTRTVHSLVPTVVTLSQGFVGSTWLPTQIFGLSVTDHKRVSKVTIQPVSCFCLLVCNFRLRKAKINFQAKLKLSSRVAFRLSVIGNDISISDIQFLEISFISSI